MLKYAHDAAGKSPLVRRALMIVAVAVAGLSSFAAMPALPAAAAPPAPVEAEGNSYSLYANVSVLGGTPIIVGPLNQSLADVPSPPNPKLSQTGVADCGPSNCVGPVVDSLHVLNDTGKAFVPGYNGGGASTPFTDCLPNGTPPATFVTGPLTGGNGCSNITSAGVLSGLLTTFLPGGIVANGVNSQSLTQSCTATPGSGQVGLTNVVSLKIGVLPVTIPANIAPNTVIAVGTIATVILNEQKFEDLSGGTNSGQSTGHGLVVNAIHILLNIPAIATADIIIGHSSSRAVCDQAVPPQCPSASPLCPGNPITKTVVTPTGTPAGSPTPIANPGDTILYTISIANQDSCPDTRVVDTLPEGFTLLGASGDLGTSPTTSTVNGHQTVIFQTPPPFGFHDPLVERLAVLVGPSVAPGTYINAVDVFSSRCGETPGSGGGVTVPAQPVASPTPTPTNLPNTSTGGFVPGTRETLLLFALGALGAILLATIATWRLARTANARD